MSVRHALLGLLARNPAHGYDLHTEFEALAGGRANWEVKPAQIYTTLARLEDAGLIEQSATRRVGGPDQRVYGLTPAGHEELAKWLRQSVHPSHLRDEFFLKLMLALDSGVGGADALVSGQRVALYRDLHELTTRRTRFRQERDLAHALLLDKAVMHLEADLRWLDMVEGRLRQIAEQPVRKPPPRRRGRPRKAGPPGSGDVVRLMDAKELDGTGDTTWP